LTRRANHRHNFTRWKIQSPQPELGRGLFRFARFIVYSLSLIGRRRAGRAIFQKRSPQDASWRAAVRLPKNMVVDFSRRARTRRQRGPG
jgi:hypothetical protein